MDGSGVAFARAKRPARASSRWTALSLRGPRCTRAVLASGDAMLGATSGARCTTATQAVLRATRREGWRSGRTIRRLACSRLTSMPRTRANCAYHDSVSGTIWRRSEQFGVRIKFLWITRASRSSLMAGQLRLTTTKVKADPREQTLVRRFAIALADFHGEGLKLRACTHKNRLFACTILEAG